MYTLIFSRRTTVKFDEWWSLSTQPFYCEIQHSDVSITVSVFLREWALVVRLSYQYVLIRNSITYLVNRNLKLFKSLGAHIVWNSYLFIFKLCGCKVLPWNVVFLINNFLNLHFTVFSDLNIAEEFFQFCTDLFCILVHNQLNIH